MNVSTKLNLLGVIAILLFTTLTAQAAGPVCLESGRKNPDFSRCPEICEGAGALRINARVERVVKAFEQCSRDKYLKSLSEKGQCLQRNEALDTCVKQKAGIDESPEDTLGVEWQEVLLRCTLPDTVNTEYERRIRTSDGCTEAE